MKRRPPWLFNLLFSLVFLSGLSAQYVYDPNDRLYADLLLWEGRGYISNLPPLRPYPPQLVLSLLRQVERSADDAGRARASAYRAYLEEDFKLQPSIAGRLGLNPKGPYLEGSFMVEGSWWLRDWLWIGGRSRYLGIDDTNGEPLSTYERSRIDIFEDQAEFTAFGRSIKVRNSQNADFAAGDESMYFKAGIMRSSFGPLWGDGVVLSSEAPHAGHFSFSWRLPGLTYQTLLLGIAATRNLPDPDKPDEKFPDKYLTVQSFTFHVADWANIGYFETVVWGNRFETLYLLPFKQLFYAQSMTGFADNSLAGFFADIRPTPGIKLPLVVYLDDLDLNSLLKLDFGSKWKVAIQGGVQWFPEIVPLAKVQLDYTMVTPYMYTHGFKGTDPVDGGEAVNYTNYTHLGTNMGVGLQPNSDRLNLEVSLRPLDWLTVALSGRMIRHANASVDIPTVRSWLVGSEAQGTWFDDGRDADGYAAFNEGIEFLGQSPIETVAQAGLGLQFDLSPSGGLLGGGQLSVDIGYTFEYIVNAGLVSGKTEINHYISFGGHHRF